MKNDNCTEFGLNEMDSREMSHVYGGNWLAIASGWKFYAAYFLFEMATNPQAHIDAFKAGWEAAAE